MVGNQALGSRVRFTEAKCTTPDKISEEVTLTELAQPRTSYMPFYSNVTKKDYGKKATPGYDDNGREIRGRKFYWHSGNFNELNSDVEKTERNSTVQIAESGTEFEFKVYFDSITKQELKKLIFVLNLGENTETGNLCHKIGHGKPVGLGSVKIFVSKIQTRQFDGEEYKIESYAEDYEEKPQDIDFESDTIKALLKICNLDSVHDVSYPYVVDKAGKQYKGTDNNDLASHKWFTENTSSKLGNRNRDVQFLPQINAPAQNLKPYQADTYAKEAVKYKIGSIYTGKVTGYNEKKTSARITLNNGGTASLFFRDLPNVRFGEIDKSLPKGKDVKVRYMGKEGKFEKWEKVNDEI
jgi:hypothetical protein